MATEIGRPPPRTQQQQPPPPPPPAKERAEKEPAEKPKEKPAEPKDSFVPAPAPRPPQTHQPTEEKPQDKKVGGVGAPGALFKPTGSVSVSTKGDTLTLSAQGSVDKEGATKPGGTKVPGIKPRLQASGSASASVEVKAEIPKAAATEAMRQGQLPNPADPASLPTGTKLSAEVKGEVSANGTLARAMRGLGGAVRGALGPQGNFARSDSAKVELEKVNPDTMRATVTRNTEQSDGGSFRGVGGQQEQSLTRTHSADFKINTPEGRAAYDQFLKSGQLPAANGPGVEGVKQTVEKDVTKAPTVLGLQLTSGHVNSRIESTSTGHRSTLDATAPGLGNVSRDTVTTPQGIHSRTDFNGTISAEFKQLNGQEPTKEYTLKITDPQAAQLARAAFTGKLTQDTSPLQVKLDEGQMRGVLREALNARQPGAGEGMHPSALDHQLAALSYREQQTLAQALFQRAFPPGGRPQRIPGEVQ